MAGAVICHRGCFDDDILRGSPRSYRFEHFMGRRDFFYMYKRRTRKRGRACYQRHICAPQHTVFCQGVSHFSGGMVRDEPYRVYRLCRRACRHQDFHTFHVFFAGKFPKQVVKQRFGFRHFTVSFVAARQQSCGGLHNLKPILLQDFDIVLDNSVLVHTGIHGRSSDFRACAGKDGSGEHIIRQAMRHLADDICRSRGYQHGVRKLCQCYVLHLKFEIPVKSIHQAFMVCQRLKGNRVDKICGILRHNHMHVTILLYQQSGEHGNLIRCDPPRYS